MASISIKHVQKIYDGGIVAVHDFNLEIEDKEFIILVGPSGCGKSTLLRMIAGLEDISNGELIIGEKLVNDIPSKNRDIAMVFQNYALYPHMTIESNLSFGLKHRKVPQAEINIKVKEAAEILDLTHLLKRKPKALSGGQRQRVALGRAMVRHPSVFLLDEPLSNLDAKLRTVMRSEISKLHKKLETTFVYVTHDQTEAMTMGDRIVVMKDGLIQQIDTPQNLYDKPANMFVASFIGTPQMNFLPAVVHKDNGRYFAKYNNYEIPIIQRKANCKRLNEYIGKETILGIRPESLIPILDNSSYSTVLSIEVDLVEQMGAEKYIYCTNEGKDFIAKTTSKKSISSGEMIKFGVDISNIHIFCPRTEKSLIY